MKGKVTVLCLSAFLVAILLLSVAGCIRLAKPPVQQPTANQTVPSGPSSPNAPAPPTNPAGPAAPTPPGPSSPTVPNPPSPPSPVPPNPPANQSGMGVLQGNPPANQSGIGVLQGNPPSNPSGMGVLQGDPPASPSGMGVLKDIPTPPAKVYNWSGKWLCGEWGTLTIAQSGDVVTGTYTYENGKLKGNVGGNKLFGTWSEEPSYSIPNDAGDVEFTMSADGNSFTGQWRYGFTGDWRTWNGQKDLTSQLPPGSN